MTCCADSTKLRTHLDHPDPALDAHLDTCGPCAAMLRSVAADAGFTRRSLALLDHPPESERSAIGGMVDVEAALTAARARTAPSPAVPLAGARCDLRRSLGRRLSLAAAAALVVVIVGLTPGGRSAFAQALDAFRGERLQVVTVDMAAWAASLDPARVGTLAALGEVDVSNLSEPVEVSDMAEAEALAGITGPSLAEAPDRVAALSPGAVRLVLTAREGNGVPAELDGAVLVVDVPGAIGAIYGPAAGPPEVIVGRSGPLLVRAEGAPLEAIRSFLLSREELPADLRAQLAAIDDWRSTIPVPVPLDGPGWKEIEVAGRPGIAFGDDSGLGALVLRQDPAGVTVVGGRIGVSRALELAGRA